MHMTTVDTLGRHFSSVREVSNREYLAMTIISKSFTVCGMNVEWHACFVSLRQLETSVREYQNR
jgi:hypothetical protein